MPLMDCLWNFSSSGSVSVWIHGTCWKKLLHFNRNFPRRKTKGTHKGTEWVWRHVGVKVARSHSWLARKNKKILLIITLENVSGLWCHIDLGNPLGVSGETRKANVVTGSCQRAQPRPGVAGAWLKSEPLRSLSEVSWNPTKFTLNANHIFFFSYYANTFSKSIPIKNKRYRYNAHNFN